MALDWSPTNKHSHVDHDKDLIPLQGRLAELTKAALHNHNHLWAATAIYHITEESIKDAASGRSDLIMDSENLLTIITKCLLCGLGLEDPSDIDEPCFSRTVLK